MSRLSDELFKTANALQNSGQNPTAAQLFNLAAAQENALDASAALLAEAQTAAKIATITNTVCAQTARLSAQLAHADAVVSIATNILTIVQGASNPLSVLPAIDTVLAELGGG